jgi:hypothetical protein
MVSKELWREKCPGLKDVLSAWLVVVFALTVMNIVLSLAAPSFCSDGSHDLALSAPAVEPMPVPGPIESPQHAAAMVNQSAAASLR